MKTSESKFCTCLYFTTNALARKIEKLAIEAWKPLDLSPSHAYLLMMAIEDPGVQPGTISDHLQLSPSNISRLINKLEQKKFLVRITEGKITSVYATPAGRNLLPKLNSCLNRFTDCYHKLLGKDDSISLVNSTRIMADKLGQMYLQIQTQYAITILYAARHRIKGVYKPYKARVSALGANVPGYYILIDTSIQIAKTFSGTLHFRQAPAGFTIMALAAMVALAANDLWAALVAKEGA